MKLATAKIRKGWMPGLSSLGFRLQGSLFLRNSGVLVQAIGVQRNLHSPTWRANVSICIPDEFLKAPELQVCLSGNVSADGARCYDDRKSWWPEEDIPVQLDAILKFGIPWLDHFAEPGRLIGLLESAIEQCTSVATLLEPKLREPHLKPSFLKSLLVPGQSALPPVRQPAPNHFYLLSLLYHATENFEKGCDRATVWLDLVSKWKSRAPEEPGRTLRLLDSMGCKHKGPAS